MGGDVCRPRGDARRPLLPSPPRLLPSQPPLTAPLRPPAPSWGGRGPGAAATGGGCACQPPPLVVGWKEKGMDAGQKKGASVQPAAGAGANRAWRGGGHKRRRPVLPPGGSAPLPSSLPAQSLERWRIERSPPSSACPPARPGPSIRRVLRETYATLGGHALRTWSTNTCSRHAMQGGWHGQGTIRLMPCSTPLVPLLSLPRAFCGGAELPLCAPRRREGLQQLQRRDGQTGQVARRKGIKATPPPPSTPPS